MESGPDWVLEIGFEILSFVVVLVMVGLLSAVEKAIDSVNVNSIRIKAEEGDHRAKRLMKLLEKQTTLVSGTWIVVLFFGFLSLGIFVMSGLGPLAGYFEKQNIYFPDIVALLAIVIAVSFFYIVFALLYPKQLAIQHSEGIAMKLSLYATVFLKIVKPFIYVLKFFVDVLLRITRQKKAEEGENFSEEQVMSMLEMGQEKGALKEEGKKMINSIFAFDDKLAYEVMTPRTDVFLIDISDEPSSYVEQLMEMRYSRIPVCEGDSDNIIGILNIKDYMIKARENGFEAVELEGILRKPFFVPETKNIDSLFFELQKEKQHIALLIDEYGGFSGIVTMEDIIEEVMGNIDDEFDQEETAIEKIDEGTYHIGGSMDLDDINDEIGTDFRSENSETLGGLMIEILGEIPGDEDEDRIVRIPGYVFTIESVQDRRIGRVRVQICPEDSCDVEAEEDGGNALNKVDDR